MTPAEEAAIDWSLCSWEGARRAQHRAFLALSFQEKLAAVEEMCDLARHFEAHRREKGLPYTSIRTGERIS